MNEPTPVPRTFSLRARYLLTMQGPVLENGLVTIRDGWITGVNDSDPPEPVLDLGDVILMPGLVNAHTHLEFSDLSAPLPAGDNFADWIRAVIGYRQQQRNEPSEASGDSTAQVQATIERGQQESIQAGVTTVGEISTVPGSHRWYQQSSTQTVLFQEILGLDPEQIPERLQTAQQHLANRPPEASPLTVGLSPHAPYSMHRDLFEQTCQLAKQKQVPCALHLAESREELQLLESATGPLQEMLESLGVWNPTAITRGLTPLDYLQSMSELPRSLIIHGNFLTAAEINFLGQQSDRMSLIYCPRTYSHFQNANYPLSAMLEQGVVVALGTDSRATNPDLNLLAEMQHVAQSHPTIDPELIVQMGTMQGAQALGLANLCGTIEPGKRADLITICSNPGNSASVAEAVVTPGSRVQSVMSGGQWLVEP